VRASLAADIGVWSYSTLTTLFMLLLDATGPSGDGTCWIKEEERVLCLLSCSSAIARFSVPFWWRLLSLSCTQARRRPAPQTGTS
jgi:hypothetical protein